ncbi:MAG: lysophospholipid acyltransferase family protein [Muribaculaceae bacterium]|nr:lysophospholipid acyltransferase family protein [Muribaculaceae bacterium]
MTDTRTPLRHRMAMFALRAIARMPLRALYILSDIAFVIICYIARYRRKVVTGNLSGSFPELSKREIRRITRRFYRNFTDNFVETIKLLHISDSEIRRRITFEGTDITDSYLAQGRPVVAYFSHCGNWEWAPSLTLWSTLRTDPNVKFCQIYRPLRNKWTDNLMLLIRSRFGSVSLPKRTAFLDLLRFRKQGVATMTGFMSDQKPSHGDTIHVVRFLNRPTAIITGTETVARRLDAAVVYWDMRKIRRGHYCIRTVLITDTPTQLPEFAITDRYATLLQQTIKADPSIWLWTHKRWKHKVSFADNGKKFGV